MTLRVLRLCSVFEPEDSHVGRVAYDPIGGMQNHTASLTRALDARGVQQTVVTSRLGGPVAFSYCLSCESEQPCFKVVDCWWETFDIVQYLRDHLPEDQFDRVMNAQPRPKISSLVEMIAQARQRTQG